MVIPGCEIVFLKYVCIDFSRERKGEGERREK